MHQVRGFSAIALHLKKDTALQVLGMLALMNQPRWAGVYRELWLHIPGITGNVYMSACWANQPPTCTWNSSLVLDKQKDSDEKNAVFCPARVAKNGGLASY